MKDTGMLNGDIAIVEHNSPYGPGGVVIAVVDGGLTVKYLRRDPDGTRFLEATNPEFEPIRPSGGLEILGVVVGCPARSSRITAVSSPSWHPPAG